MICDNMEQSVFEDHVYGHELWERAPGQNLSLGIIYMTGGKKKKVLQVGCLKDQTDIFALFY